MTSQQWQSVEKALADFTLEDKLELITRLVQVVRADVSASPDDDPSRCGHAGIDLPPLIRVRRPRLARPELASDFTMEVEEEPQVL